MNTDIDRVLYINKPRGMSSFDVIRQLRQKLGVRKMGHAGTLDPLAEGLLVIGVGKATKELTALVGLDKVYDVTIELGERRDSGDKEGEVLEERKVSIGEVPHKKVLEVLGELTGEVQLPVPIYSAVKKGGKPLYKRARKGEHVEPPVRTMTLYSLKLMEIGEDMERGRVLLRVEMHVASGVYVRSVAEEVGRRLGLPATVSRLIRTKVGDIELEDALLLNEM